MVKLRLYRHNGEYVRSLDCDVPTWDLAKQLVWRYLGDANRRTDLAVWDDWNDAEQPGCCVLHVSTPSETQFTVRWDQCPRRIHLRQEADARAKETAKVIGMRSWYEEMPTLLTSDEHAEIKSLWDTMSGGTSWTDALFEWMKRC